MAGGSGSGLDCLVSYGHITVGQSFVHSQPTKINVLEWQKVKSFCLCTRQLWRCMEDFWEGTSIVED